MKFFDCFAGIGGFRMAFEREGFECVGFCEIDKHATKLYKAFYNTENEVYYNDATTIIPEHMPDFDIFAGGFPCQAFSIAGKRQGFEDARGTLFFEIARICKVKQPKYIVLENVKGLLNHDNGRTFATILGVLSDIGYSVEWQVLNSKFFGVPQNRERVFIVGHLRGECEQKIFPIRKTNKEPFKTDENNSIIRWQNKKAGAIIDNICPTLRASGSNDIRKKPCVLQLPRGNNKGGFKEIAPTISSSCYEHNNLLVENIVIPVLTPDRVEKCQNGRRFKENGDPMFTLTAQDRHGVFLIKEATKKGYQEATLGDGINLTFPESETRRGRVQKKIAPTLDTQCNIGTVSEMTGGGGSYMIRRLTPLECFRLQGFPDDIVKKAYELGMSDGRLYGLSGNSITINVAQDVAKRIREIEQK